VEGGTEKIDIKNDEKETATLPVWPVINRFICHVNNKYHTDNVSDDLRV